MSKKKSSSAARTSSPKPAPKAAPHARPRVSSKVAWVLVVGIAFAALLGAYVYASASQRGGAQKVTVAVSTVYTPSTIQLKAGVPADITFGEGHGCTQIVQSRALGFREDLGSGPRTVRLAGLSAGTYDFECGMNMVHGQIIVR